jgi:hypothetical protein
MRRLHLLRVAASVVLIVHAAAFQRPPLGTFLRANPIFKSLDRGMQAPSAVAARDGAGVVRKGGIRGCSNLGMLPSVAAWSPKVMSRHVGHARCSGRISTLQHSRCLLPPFHTLTLVIGEDQRPTKRGGPQKQITDTQMSDERDHG